MIAARSGTRLRALVGACHPLPSLGVSVFAVLLGVAAGNTIVRCLLMGAAVLAGQLSIGWSNDRHDLAADRQVGRPDKPLATGELSRQLVDAAIVVAVLAAIVLSLLLGWRAGLVHLAAVGAGWLYNLWLKGTWASWLPYAFAFGALPAVATLARPDHPAPAAWAMLAGAMLGVAANLTNALPDLEADRATGVHGAPHRIGAQPSLLLAAALLMGAAVVVAAGPPGEVTVIGWVGAAVVGGLVVIAVPVLWTNVATRAPFYALMAAVPIELAMILVTGRLR